METQEFMETQGSMEIQANKMAPEIVGLKSDGIKKMSDVFF